MLTLFQLKYIFNRELFNAEALYTNWRNSLHDKVMLKTGHKHTLVSVHYIFENNY